MGAVAAQNTADKVIERAADAQVQALLEAAWAVRDAAEVRRKTIRQALENLAAGLCAVEINAQRLVIGDMDDSALYQFIGNTAKAKIDDGNWYKTQFDAGRDARDHAVTAAEKKWQEELAEVMRELEAARERTDSLTKTNDTLRADLARKEKAAKGSEDALRKAEKTIELRDQRIAEISMEVLTLRQQLSLAAMPAARLIAVPAPVAPMSAPPASVAADLVPASPVSVAADLVPASPASVTADLAPMSSGSATTDIDMAQPAEPVGETADALVPPSPQSKDDAIADQRVVDLDTWRASIFWRTDADFLNLVGRSMECRRNELFQGFSKAKSNATRVAMIKRLLRLDLLRAIEVRDRAGNAPQLLMLGPLGLSDYSERNQAAAVDAYARYLVKHKSPGQIRLMLEVCDVFTAAGYVVERFPEVKTLGNNRIFDPDLMITRGSDRMCIELETDAFKGLAPRVSKWRNIAEGNNGYIFVVQYSETRLDQLRSEILGIEYKHLVTVGVTTLAALTNALQSKTPLMDLFGRLRTVPQRPVNY